MRRVRPNRQSSFEFQQLESRKLLATTVYVDFGGGFEANGGLTISDTDSAAVGGPEVFGNAWSLTSLSQDYFQDFSSGSEESFEAFKEKVVVQLNYLFEPFNIDLQIVSSSTLAEVSATLGATETNDAYVHVGGSIPGSVSGDIGAATLDAGNSTDNLGFVFSDTFDFQFFGNEYALAAAIARQAAVSFGVQTTEYSDPQSIRNVLSTVGTDSDGNPTSNRVSFSAHYEFVRFDMPRTFENGVSPGTSNSFEELRAVVGTNAAQTEYFTGTFGEASVELEVIGEDLINFSLNGKQWNNVDTSNGLIFRNLLGSSTVVNLKGRAFDITAASAEISIDPNITIQTNAGAFPGTPIEIRTDGFDDTLELLDKTLSVFDLGGGDDTFTIPIALGLTSTLNGGEGDDRFVFTNTEVFTEGFSERGIFDAGVGFDTVDYSAIDEVVTLSIWDVDTEGYTFGFLNADRNVRMEHSGFERAIAPDDHSFDIAEGAVSCGFNGTDGCVPTSGPVHDDNIVSIIDGDNISIEDTVLEKELQVSGSVSGLWSHELFLLSTVRDLTLRGNDIQISSTMNPEEGTTDTILHNVTVTDGQILISNMAGAGRNININTDFENFRQNTTYTGLTGGQLIASGIFAFPPEIHLSDSGNDRVTITGDSRFFQVQAKIFGNGGDDTFIVGSTPTEMSGNLDFIFNDQVELLGGDGNDFLYLNDAATENEDGWVYDLSDSEVRSYPRPNSSSGQGLRNGGFLHEGIETVRLETGEGRDIFRVAPSPNAAFVVAGSTPGIGDGDSLELVGDSSGFRSHIVRDAQGAGTWYFGNEEGANKSVFFDSVEHVAQSQRLAIGSQAGVPSLVRVLNAQTQEHLFDIRPYPARFLGGVQVETADFNGDSVPDIVVAPGAGRYALIQIYDGRNGQRIGGFHAFPGENPDPSKNFLGGADIAIGNVRGDSGYEIIASTLTGTHFVRTFAQQLPLEFAQIDGYNVFPNATRAGVRVATGDFDGDGYDDIVSTPGPGWLPQIAVHSLQGISDEGAPVNRRLELTRFLGNVPNYRGGFNVAAADINNDQRADILVTAIKTGSANDLFSGELRIFTANSIPTNSGDAVVEPYKRISAFSRDTRGIGIHLLDADHNGVLERIDLSVQLGGRESERGMIKRIRSSDPFEEIDTIFTNAAQFGAGLEI